MSTTLHLDLIQAGFHQLDKSPRRAIEPADGRLYLIPPSDRGKTDPEFMAAMLPLFNAAIAQHASVDAANRDMRQFLAAKHDENPENIFRQFYSVVSRAMLLKFADCCQRQAMGEDVSGDIENLKQLYKKIVEQDLQPCNPQQNINFRDSAIQVPQDEHGLFDKMVDVVGLQMQDDRQAALADRHQVVLSSTPVLQNTLAESDDAFLARLRAEHNFPVVADMSDDKAKSFMGAMLKTQQGRQTIMQLCGGKFNLRILVSNVRKQHGFNSRAVGLLSDAQMAKEFSGNIFQALAYIDKLPAERFMDGNQTQIIRGIVKYMRGPAFDTKATWHHLQQFINSAPEDELREVSLTQLKNFSSKYGVRIVNYLDKLSRAQQLHMLNVAGSAANKLAIAREGQPDLQLNCIEALAYAVRLSYQSGSSDEVVCNIANMALAQMLPDNPPVLAAHIARQPMDRPAVPAHDSRIADLQGVMPVAMWRSNRESKEPGLAAFVQPNKMMAVVAAKPNAAEAVADLTARYSQPAEQSARVYVGTPEQVGGDSDLVKHLQSVAVDGSRNIPHASEELTLGKPGEDKRTTYTQSEIDAAMAVIFRQKNGSVDVRHYKRQLPAAPKSRSDTVWIPGADLVDDDGELDSAKLNAAIGQAFTDRLETRPERIVTVVQLAQGDARRFITIALDVGARNQETDKHVVKALVHDPKGESENLDIQDALIDAVNGYGLTIAARPGQKKFQLDADDYKVTSDERADALQDVEPGDDAVLALAFANGIATMSAHDFARVQIDNNPKVSEQADKAINYRRRQYSVMKRLSCLTEPQRVRMANVTGADNGLLAADGRLQEAEYNALARPIAYQVVALPNPSLPIVYPEWVANKAGTKQNFEKSVLHRRFANLYFLAAQGKQICLPSKDADGHYQLQGMSDSSWMHKHQAFVDTEFDRLAAFSRTMQAGSYRQQQDAVKGLYDIQPTYFSAFYAGEASDAIGLDSQEYDDHFKRAINTSPAGTVVDHICYRPVSQQDNSFLCQRSQSLGEHLLPVDEGAMKLYRSQLRRRAALRAPLNLGQNLRIAYEALFRPTDNDGDVERFQTKLQQLMGEEDYDRLMGLVVRRNSGMPAVTAAELDICFADCQADSTKRMHAAVIQQALLTPLSDDCTLAQYYSRLVRTIGNELQLGVKDNAEFKDAQGVSYASFEELFLVDEYTKTEAGKFTDNRNPGHGEFDSLQEMYSARGIAGSVTTPDQALYAALPNHVLTKHLKNVAAAHNEKQTAAKDKTKVVIFDCGQYGGVEAGFTQLTRDIRRYLNSSDPAHGQKFFSVLLRIDPLSNEGHYVSVAVNHAERAVTVIDPRADDAEFTGAVDNNSGKIFQRRAQRLQHDLRQIDPQTFEPAIEDVAVINYSQPVDGFDGFTPQRKDETFCGDHAIAMLHAVMNKGAERAASIASQRQAELVAQQAVMVASLGPVPDAKQILFKDICTDQAVRLLRGRGDNVQFDVTREDLNEANLRKLSALNPRSWYNTVTRRSWAGAAYGEYELQQVAQLLTEAKVDVSAVDDLPGDALDALVKSAKQHMLINPGMKVASQLHRKLKSPDAALPEGMVVDGNLSSAQRAGLLAKNKQKTTEAQWQSFFDSTNWSVANAWHRLRGELNGSEDGHAKQELAAALAQVCTEAGIDLTKVADVSTLPQSVAHELRHAAQAAVCRVITAADLDAQGTDQAKHELITARNRAEFDGHVEFWQAALDTSQATIEQNWLPAFERFGIDLAALRSDRQGQELLSHFVSAHNQLHDVGLAEGTPYVQRQQMQEKYSALGLALHNYQHAVRESVAYADGDVAEQQVLLEAVDANLASFKSASTSCRQQIQQVDATRNRTFIAAELSLSRQATGPTHFIRIVEVLREPGESLNLYILRLLQQANSQGIDLRSENWQEAAAVLQHGGVAGAAELRAQRIQAICDAHRDIKQLYDTLKQPESVSQQAPTDHAWYMRPTSADQWNQYKVDWQQSLTVAHAAEFKASTPDFSNEDFKQMARHVSAAGGLIVAAGASAPVMPVGDPRLNDIPALRAANLAKLNGVEAQMPLMYRGAANANRRQMLAHFATAMNINLSDVNNAQFAVAPGNDNAFEHNSMVRLMQLAEPFMAANGYPVDLPNTKLSQVEIDAARLQIHPRVRGAIVTPPPAALLHMNAVAITKLASKIDFGTRLYAADAADTLKNTLRSRFADLATQANINLTHFLPVRGDIPAVTNSKKLSLHQLLTQLRPAAELSNNNELTQHKEFYLDLSMRVNPITDFNWRRASYAADQPIHMAAAPDDVIIGLLQQSADESGIDLAQLRSTQVGMQVLNQWMQGVSLAVYQSYLSAEDVDPNSIKQQLLSLSQAVANFQASPEDPARLQAVKDARQSLSDSCKQPILAFNKRVLFSNPADLPLRRRVDSFIRAYLAQAPAAVVTDESVAELRTQLAVFLNAHGRPLPACEHWPEPPAVAAAVINVNEAPQLCDLLATAKEFYSLRYPQKTLANMTAGTYLQRLRRVKEVAEQIAQQPEASLASIPSDLDQVDDIAEEHRPIAGDAAGMVVSAEQHLDFEGNSDNWWNTMLKTPASQGFVLSDKAAWISHLKDFCGTQINLNQLASHNARPEYNQVIQQMLRVLIQQQHDVYPPQSDAVLQAYKSALEAYITDPVSNDAQLLLAYTHVSGSVPARTQAAPGPRHPRLQKHLQQQIAKHIFDKKSLDVFLQHEYPDTAVDEGRLDILRMQVVQYMQKFDITRFDFPSADTLANADAQAVLVAWRDIVQGAVAYDATVIAGRRLGVAHNAERWNSFAQAQLESPGVLMPVNLAASVVEAKLLLPNNEARIEANASLATAQWAGDKEIDQAVLPHVVNVANQAGVKLSAIDSEPQKLALLVACAKLQAQANAAADAAIADALILTADERALLLPHEIKAVMPMPVISLVRMLATSAEELAPVDQIDQRLTQLLTTDVPALHVLLERLDGQGADHAEARAHIIRAVLLFKMAEHAGVTLHHAPPRGDVAFTLEQLTQATQDYLDPDNAATIDNVKVVGQAIFQAYQRAAEQEPALKSMLAPTEQQTATAAERLAQLHTQQAGRPADVYEGADPRPGTEAYRHHLLQQMRRNTAEAAGGLDASQRVPEEDISNEDDIEALRRRTVADRSQSESDALFQQMLGRRRAHLQFVDKDGVVKQDIQHMFGRVSTVASVVRTGYEHHPDGHPDKFMQWEETLPTGYHLSQMRCTAGTLYFEAPQHTIAQADFSVTRNVSANGGVSFTIDTHGFGNVDYEAKARVYAAMLAREFYRHDKDGKLHPVAIDIKAFKAEDIFGKGIKQEQAQELLKNAFKTLHACNPELIASGEPKLYFAEDAAKKPKPKESREQKQQPPAQRNAATDWVGTLSDAQMSAQDRADARQMLLNPGVKPEQITALMQQPEPRRIAAIQQNLQRARTQQQAAAAGGDPSSDPATTARPSV
ncbi:MAG: hypothetical protein P1U63_10060 [Coxiellaceae bacterium]|nr:hypothetical protein [Coxiellaceae bacterium]